MRKECIVRGQKFIWMGLWRMSIMWMESLAAVQRQIRQTCGLWWRHACCALLNISLFTRFRQQKFSFWCTKNPDNIKWKKKISIQSARVNFAFTLSKYCKTRSRTDDPVWVWLYLQVGVRPEEPFQPLSSHLI